MEKILRLNAFNVACYMLCDQVLPTSLCKIVKKNFAFQSLLNFGGTCYEEDEDTGLDRALFNQPERPPLTPSEVSIRFWTNLGRS